MAHVDRKDYTTRIASAVPAGRLGRRVVATPSLPIMGGGKVGF
jgi:hypothetical protein